MKGNYISAFPTLSRDHIDKSGIDPSSYEFSYSYYRDEDEPNAPLTEDIENNLFLSFYDEAGVWSVDTHNLIIKGHYIINNASVLFGPEGIAPSNSEIALYLRWGSSETKNRNVKKIGVIKNIETCQNFDVQYEFPANSLRGQVKLSYEYVIENSCILHDEETHLASTKGTIIGEEQLYILAIDAKDTCFPIEHIEELNGPLWKLKIEDVDYTEKPFITDYVAIQINRSHPKFSCVDNTRRRREYEPTMLKEIIANAMCLMIEYIRSTASKKLEDILDADQSDWEPGCIAETILNFQNSPMNFDYKTPVSTSLSIHNFVYNNLDSL